MNIKNYILGATIALITTGCSDFLKEYSQDLDYIRSWKDLDELLIGSAYLQVQGAEELYAQNDNFKFMYVLTDDIEENTCSPNGGRGFYSKEASFGNYTWQQRPGTKPDFTGYEVENKAWKECYYNINVTNNVMNSLGDIDTSTDEAREAKMRIEGESHFLRALYYFWLVNMYAKPYVESTAQQLPGVPLKLSAEVEDKKFSRNTIQETYDLILSDLDNAHRNLGALTTAKKSIYRADSTAVNLLLSRVHLYMQHWKEASYYADLVIKAHPELENLNSTTEKFCRKSNPENIFSMGGSSVPCVFEPSVNAFSISHDLYNQYNVKDNRRAQWFFLFDRFIGTIRYPESNRTTDHDITSPNYYMYNYYSGWQSVKSEVSGVFWFRSAEAYLNKAEAQAYLHHDAEAKEALETLRRNRFTSDMTTVEKSGDDLIREIRNERRREFPFEGHRWFDLRRYCVCNALPESKKITHAYYDFSEQGEFVVTDIRTFELEEFDEAYTLPIPYEVLQFNSGMENNIRPWRDPVSIEIPE